MLTSSRQWRKLGEAVGLSNSLRCLYLMLRLSTCLSVLDLGSCIDAAGGSETDYTAMRIRYGSTHVVLYLGLHAPPYLANQLHRVADHRFQMTAARPRPSSFRGHVTRRSATGCSLSPHPASGTTCCKLSPHRPTSPPFDVGWRHTCFPRATLTDFSYKHLYSGLAVIDLRHFNNIR